MMTFIARQQRQGKQQRGATRELIRAVWPASVAQMKGRPATGGRAERLAASWRLPVILAGLAVVIFGSFWWSRTWHPSETEFPDQGFELSAEAGEVNWVAARANGAAFVYLDATQGHGVRSPRMLADWQAAHQAGLRRGALHHYDLCKLASDQATSFIAAVPRDAAALPPALALELDERCVSRPSRTVLLQEIATFAQMVEAHSGKPLIIRVSRAFESEYAISRAIDRPLWLSSFFLQPAYGERPWLVWEANGSRTLEGVGHSVPWLVLRP